MMRYLVIILLFIILTGCSSAPPVPTDHFYRFKTPTQGDIGKQRLTDQVIYINSFLAEGLYNERALLYTNDNLSQELQQYHYHFWITSPPDLLRDYLVSFLRAADTSPVIITGAGVTDGLQITGRVTEFEKLDSGNQSYVNVALELRLDKQGNELPLLLKEYRANEQVQGKSLTDVITSFNTAVLRIYSDFVTDMESAL
ncbi:MAG: membrane integrity-associated transporter subunit PqiC [Gammaproteobacteria bacterium]|nr:membrane integrity-associated transporter subunit PqiC [Gammaproteobacteria bacterium]